MEDNSLREAKKFLSLMNEFDIKQGSNMEENLIKNKKEILEMKEQKVLSAETIESIIESEELLKDFVLIRETLREDIKATRMVLATLSEDLASMSTEELNGQVVMAFSDIKKSNVKSMELLIDSYEKVAKTQLEVKKLAGQMKDKGNDPTIQNAVFVGSPDDLLKSLSK